MRPLLLLGLGAVAAVVSGTPLMAQNGPRDEGQSWQLARLRSGFCVHLLIDPAAAALRALPPGIHPLPAGESADMHASLRGVIEGQPEFASWSPSRLCFYALDTVRTSEYTAGDKSGRKSKLLAMWTILASDGSGAPQQVGVGLFTNVSRLIRTARLGGVVFREARLKMGKVPSADADGTPNPEDRFEVRVGKTTITWDGHLAGDSVAVAAPLEVAWISAAGKAGEVVTAPGRLHLTPRFSRAMVGSIRVEGRDDFAKALKASPTRFCGPAYLGGDGSFALPR
jgi:hypothetical protein